MKTVTRNVRGAVHISSKTSFERSIVKIPGCAQILNFTPPSIKFGDEARLTVNGPQRMLKDMHRVGRSRGEERITGMRAND